MTQRRSQECTCPLITRDMEVYEELRSAIFEGGLFALTFLIVPHVALSLYNPINLVWAGICSESVPVAFPVELT